MKVPKLVRIFRLFKIKYNFTCLSLNKQLIEKINKIGFLE